MDSVKPPDSHLDLLQRPLFAHLATVRADGGPQVNPMWFLYEADRNRVLLTHTRARHNFRYLQRDPRVALSIIDPDDGYRYVQLRGEVEQIEDDPTGGFYQVLQERYRGFKTEVADRDVRVILTVRPTAWKVRPAR